VVLKTRTKNRSLRNVARTILVYL